MAWVDLHVPGEHVHQQRPLPRLRDLQGQQEHEQHLRAQVLQSATHEWMHLQTPLLLVKLLVHC
jgi:hypothetical protein